MTRLNHKTAKLSVLTLLISTFVGLSSQNFSNLIDTQQNLKEELGACIKRHDARSFFSTISKSIEVGVEENVLRLAIFKAFKNNLYKLADKESLNEMIAVLKSLNVDLEIVESFEAEISRIEAPKEELEVVETVETISEIELSETIEDASEPEQIESVQEEEAEEIYSSEFEDTSIELEAIYEVETNEDNLSEPTSASEEQETIITFGDVTHYGTSLDDITEDDIIEIHANNKVSRVPYKSLAGTTAAALVIYLLYLFDQSRFEGHYSARLTTLITPYLNKISKFTKSVSQKSGVGESLGNMAKQVGEVKGQKSEIRIKLGFVTDQELEKILSRTKKIS